jgi:DNA-binding transcriptional ArsR family regulator
MDTMLRALADGTRRQILNMVSPRELTAGEIAAEFPFTRPAISQHLAVLVKSDLVVMRRAGTRRLYSVNPRAVARLRAAFESFWDESLLSLKDAAEAAAWETTKSMGKRPRRKAR